MANRKLRSDPHLRSILIQFKANEIEAKALQKNADEWCGGNLSDWLRYAGIVLKPRQEDVENG